MVSEPTQPQSDAAPASRLPKLVVGIAVVLAITVVWYLLDDKLSLDYLAQQESWFRSLQDQYAWLVFGGAFVLYVVVTGLSLPGAAVLTILYGWLFGWLAAVVLVSFASTSGATIAFLLSRYLLRDAVQSRFDDRLIKFNEALQRDGAFYLFTLRLVVQVPFFIINLVMGLTDIRTLTFWWVSQLGMLPGTALYTYIGSAVPSLAELAEQGISAVFSAAQLSQFFIGFALLGAFPWLAKWLIRKFGPVPLNQ